MNSFTKIGLGILIGITLYHFLGQNQLPLPTTPPAGAEKKVAPDIVKTSPKEVMIRPQASANAIATRTPSRQPERLTVSLTEGHVQQLENRWNDLPQLAEAHKEPRGWRIVRVDPQSPLAEAGLRAGDLVTLEFLDNLRQTPELASLAIRVEQILNQISR